MMISQIAKGAVFSGARELASELGTEELPVFEAVDSLVTEFVAQSAAIPAPDLLTVEVAWRHWVTARAEVPTMGATAAGLLARHTIEMCPLATYFL